MSLALLWNNLTVGCSNNQLSANSTSFVKSRNLYSTSSFSWLITLCKTLSDSCTVYTIVEDLSSRNSGFRNVCSLSSSRLKLLHYHTLQVFRMQQLCLSYSQGPLHAQMRGSYLLVSFVRDWQMFEQQQVQWLQTVEKHILSSLLTGNLVSWQTNSVFMENHLNRLKHNYHHLVYLVCVISQATVLRVSMSLCSFSPQEISTVIPSFLDLPVMPYFSQN